MNIFIAEITAWDPGTAGVITYRFASGRGFDNAGTFYAPRIENPATFTRSMGVSAGGRAGSSYGELTLVNTDGGLDGMADDFFDGRTLTLKYGDEAGSYGSFTTILVATIETIAVEGARVSVRLRQKSFSAFRKNGAKGL